ncbi:MAG TPA: hypothetical protein VLG76_06265 [Rhabdochlamydiaceae bacterium]|nr:hypothetical protein [Rhabdochlamydiaceae bacterium]
MRSRRVRRFLFFGCMIFSIGIHGSLVFLFFKSPLSLRQKLSSFWFKSSNKPDLLLARSHEKLPGNVNQVLEESFSRVVAVNAQRPKVRELEDEEIAENGPEEEVEEQEAPEETNEEFVQSEEVNEEIEECETAQEECVESEDQKETETREVSQIPEPTPIEEEEKEQASNSNIENEPLFELYPDKDPFANQIFQKSEDLDFAQELRNLDKSTPDTKEFVDDFSIRGTSQISQATPKERKKENNLPQFLKKHYEALAFEEAQAEISCEAVPASKPSYVLTNPGEYLREEWISRPVADAKLPDIEYYGLSTFTNALLWEEEIHVDVSYTLDPEAHKYIFSLVVNPDFDLEAEPLQQNFYFIIDRSNSVKKQRFNGYKRAVQRALSALQEGDKFNIHIIDKTISRLSEKNLFVSAKNLKLAEEFLEKEDYKPFFSGNDLYTSLDRIFSFAQTSDELHSAVLISDGNTLLSSVKQKKAILNWAEKNKGKLNLYTATSGQGNNLVLLDLLSYATSGKLLYSDTNASFPRKLVKLVKDLHDPMVKEVSIDAVANERGNNISIYPSKTILPPLHVKKPFVVVGTIDDLEDFTLFIQGRNRGRWLNIKKTISFKDASKGGRSLEKLWAFTQANLCYDQFLKEGKNTHLKEAKKILTPYKAPICLE